MTLHSTGERGKMALLGQRAKLHYTSTSITPSDPALSKQLRGFAGGVIRFRAATPVGVMMNEMTVAERAYLAGMIDGEGCIHISCNRGRYYVLALIVTGTAFEHIEHCRQMAGVGRFHEKVHEDPQKANTFFWKIYSRDAEALLRVVLPYLYLKRPQAELALRFADHMTNSPFYNGHHPMPLAVLKLRQQMMDELKALKRGGKIYDGEVIEAAPLRPTWCTAPLFGD